MTERPKIFISYSHKDEVWKDRLVTHLGVLEQLGQVLAWDDRRIGAGQDWLAQIEEALEAASVAVLLVSEHFPSSRFIMQEEVPRLLQRRTQQVAKSNSRVCNRAATCLIAPFCSLMAA